MAKPDFEVDPITIPATSDIAWNRWPGRTAAAKMLGVSMLQVRNLENEGQLKVYKAPDGSRRYDPDEVTALNQALVEAEGEREETTVGGRPIEGMRAATDLLKQSQQHNERIIDQMLRGYEVTMKSLADTVTRQNEYIGQLEIFKFDAMRKLQEATESNSTAEVELLVKMASEERRNQLVAMLLPQAAPIIGKLFASLGDIANAKIRADGAETQPSAEPAEQSPEPLSVRAERLLRSVGPKQLGLLASSGMLPDEDAKLLHDIAAELPQESEKTS